MDQLAINITANFIRVNWSNELHIDQNDGKNVQMPLKEFKPQHVYASTIIGYKINCQLDEF